MKNIYVRTMGLLHMGKLKYVEHIAICEGRALMWGVCHAVRASSSRERQALFLVDKMALCLAVTRGRSSSQKRNLNLRVIAAHTLATQLILKRRWIPLEWNVAEG